MATAEELYRSFGPKLIDAQSRVIRNEINILRAKVGLPERTLAQVVNAIQAELDEIPDYPWMHEDM